MRGQENQGEHSHFRLFALINYAGAETGAMHPPTKFAGEPFVFKKQRCKGKTSKS
jgi:hypothetical protein